MNPITKLLQDVDSLYTRIESIHERMNRLEKLLDSFENESVEQTVPLDPEMAFLSEAPKKRRKKKLNT
jgi:hypothetical protein